MPSLTRLLPRLAGAVLAWAVFTGALVASHPDALAQSSMTRGDGIACTTTCEAVAARE